MEFQTSADPDLPRALRFNSEILTACLSFSDFLWSKGSSE
jgi:hypothetical protein